MTIAFKSKIDVKKFVEELRELKDNSMDLFILGSDLDINADLDVYSKLNDIINNINDSLETMIFSKKHYIYVIMF